MKTNPDIPPGNGLILYICTQDIDDVKARVTEMHLALENDLR